MERFKKGLFFILISIFLLINYANAQYTYWTADPPTKYYDPIGYFVDSVYICIENNLFNKNAILVASEESYLMGGNTYIYGPELRISVYSVTELIQNGELDRKRYPPNILPINETKFKIGIEDLEFKVEGNKILQNNWNSVAKAKSTIDTLSVKIHAQKEKIFYKKGKLIVNAAPISNGDSISVYFRKSKQPAFLKLKFIKKDPLLSVPLVMGNFHSYKKEISIAQFIQKAYKHYLTIDQSFYQYWPGSNVKQNDKVFEDSKLALFFRPRTDIANDSAFEYRLFTNVKASQWKKSDNIIYAYDLRAGNQYRLEVRYTDKPQYVYYYKFYVPANWYQSAWFKAAIIFILLLIAMLLYFFFKNIRRKRLQAEQVNKVRALSAQLNPHFVFNALGSIQGLLNNGQIENANHYLSGFGKLLRNTLTSTEKNTITFQEEMNNIEHYIQLEQLRKDFNYIVEVQDSINLQEIEMLPLLFQPVIENAIKHGPKGDEAFEMKLTINRNNDNMEIFIKDNGKGFDVHSPKNGQGLKLTKARIDLFNLTTKHKRIVQKISSNGNGTIFNLAFINWLRND